MQRQEKKKTPLAPFYAALSGKVRTQREAAKKKAIVTEVLEDFERRRRARMPLELQWQLNTNFLMGNQYCDINVAAGRIMDVQRSYFWQEREVFNHIAPIVETRLAKLSRVQPGISVRPATEDASDIGTAKVCTAIVQAAGRKVDISALLNEGTVWSEICGTVFYKTIWNGHLGSGAQPGDIEVAVCPPYEIFPDALHGVPLHRQQSIIHARAYHVREIKHIWGTDVQGGEVDVYTLGSTPSLLGGLGYSAAATSIIPTTRSDAALVIERYEAPTDACPQGRLLIVAGETLLHDGPLPYRVGEGNKVGYPFTRQTCIDNPGCFFGASVIERCIPIQRAYNAVKNRKHEMLNRTAVGILAVEDGAMDADDLQEEGLSPGKVLLYRPGAQPPHIISTGGVPAEFTAEEERLLNEFILISGVSELARQSQVPSGMVSGVAMEVLREQDDTRLSLTAEHIRKSLMDLARQWLRIYKQLASGRRVDRIVGEGAKVERVFWQASDITSDDVVTDTENELSQSPAQRKQMVLDLLKSGLFNDPDTGKMDRRMRAKVLEMLQFGNWEAAVQLDELHVARAAREQADMQTRDVQVGPYDNHELHLDEHIRFVLSGEGEAALAQSRALRRRVQEHIQAHQSLLAAQQAAATSVQKEENA
nr:hypothetical protein [Maliibacterium massiliense]